MDVHIRDNNDTSSAQSDEMHYTATATHLIPWTPCLGISEIASIFGEAERFRTSQKTSWDEVSSTHPDMLSSIQNSLINRISSRFGRILRFKRRLSSDVWLCGHTTLLTTENTIFIAIVQCSLSHQGKVSYCGWSLKQLLSFGSFYLNPCFTSTRSER